MIEQILRDISDAEPEWQHLSLRYFNPAGAHESGLIGEDPRNAPNNLMPYIAQVAVGRRPRLKVFGNDYQTLDGTGVRDYIHVTDLANGHVAGIGRLMGTTPPEHAIINLGTGIGHSVLEVVKAFVQACDRRIPFQVVERRPGDVDVSFADTSLASRYLAWHAERDLTQMCVDTWRWQSSNPDGYLRGHRCDDD
jgi:UDP-glucose 4-epimerase